MNFQNTYKTFKYKENTEYVFPCCKIKDCNGFLSFSINPYNFTINYKCEKTEMHNGSNISYQEFQSYIKKGEIKVMECFNCQLNLSNDEIYKCNKCKKIYCSECFIIDKHSKDELFLKQKICHIHKEILNYYCFNCKKNCCKKCYEIHKNHYIENIKNKLDSYFYINLKNKLCLKN